jgi:hypothetical protein
LFDIAFWCQEVIILVLIECPTQALQWTMICSVLMSTAHRTQCDYEGVVAAETLEV